jgi:MSHA biogenesis protein MshP
MRHKNISFQPAQKNTYKQRGSSLVIAVFILVVMSLLGAALIKMMRTNEDAYAYEVLGTRAYNAAQSGMQRKLQQIFPLRVAGSDPAACTNDERFDFSDNIVGLSGCFTTTNCESLTHETTTFYTITSRGECAINGEFTSRAVEVEVKSIL